MSILTINLKRINTNTVCKNIYYYSGFHKLCKRVHSLVNILILQLEREFQDFLYTEENIFRESNKIDTVLNTSFSEAEENNLFCEYIQVMKQWLVDNEVTSLLFLQNK